MAPPAKEYVYPPEDRIRLAEVIFTERVSRLFTDKRPTDKELEVEADVAFRAVSEFSIVAEAWANVPEEVDEPVKRVANAKKK